MLTGQSWDHIAAAVLLASQNRTLGRVRRDPKKIHLMFNQTSQKVLLHAEKLFLIFHNLLKEESGHLGMSLEGKLLSFLLPL